MAMISDESEPENRSKNFGLIGSGFVYIWTVMPETNREHPKIPFEISKVNPFKSFGMLLNTKLTLWMSIIYALMFLAEQGTVSFLL